MIRYRLDDLGWDQFEWLCQTLVKVELGIGVEAWGGSSDLGRDAYFDGPLDIHKTGRVAPGPFIFQAKFVSGANAARAKPGPAVKAALTSECTALKTRHKKLELERIRHYVFLTNAPLGATLRTWIRQEIARTLPRCRVTPWAGNDICAMLDNAPNVRVAFPQLLGLRDLTELLASVVEKPIRERSTLAVEQAAELAQVFVPTRAYNRALRALAEHSFVVLTGPPEMGKTTIARVVGLAKPGGGLGVP
jgi:hypothetical protein